jgi:hypothetical protein
LENKLLHTSQFIPVQNLSFYAIPESPPDVMIAHNDMTTEEFHKKAMLMNMVNDTLHKSIVPGTTKESFQELKLRGGHWKQLRALFFNRNGKLRRNIKEDIAQDYERIFAPIRNNAYTLERHDDRWRVNFRQHELRGEIIVQ